jgi:cytochrome P450
VPEWFPTSGHRMERAALEALDLLIYRIIQERLSSGKDRGDLLSTLLHMNDHSSSSVNRAQVRDEMMSFFLAGHETTANVLSWALYLLSRHPEAGDRLRQELAGVLNGRPPSAQDIPRLVYCTMVIKESLRLYPPVWIIPRIAIADVVVGDYQLKPGNVAVVCPYVTHRNPRYFPDPDRFSPDRFAPDQEALIPRFAFFPFGGGPHTCPGQSFAMMEAVLILASVAQRFRLDLVPGQQVVMDPKITLRIRDGLRLVLQPV